MKRAFATLLLFLLTFTLWGAEGRFGVAPAPVVLGEKLELYSYLFLGVEVRSFDDDEFEEFFDLLKPWPKNGRYRIAPGKRASLFMHKKTGLIITRVIPGSPADKGGLEVGDVIHDIGAAAMSTPADLQRVMRNTSPGIPLHMWLIDRNLCWKLAQPRPVARPEAAAVGHIVPLKLCSKHREELQQHQARAIQLLAMNPVPIPEACSHLESISRILYKGYTPGCLRIPLREGDCAISATRNGYDIHVTMTEGGVETRGVIRRWVISVNREAPGKPARVDSGPDVLPEAIRQRLQEIDTTGADKAPTYPHNGPGRPVSDPCCQSSTPL